MKNVLLFVAIITVCGSLMKAPVYRMCETSVLAKYYKDGKIVLKQKSDAGFCHTVNEGSIFYEGKLIKCDSIRYAPIYRMDE